jgi:hypothetical protein
MLFFRQVDLLWIWREEASTFNLRIRLCSNSSLPAANLLVHNSLPLSPGFNLLFLDPEQAAACSDSEEH